MGRGAIGSFAIPKIGLMTTMHVRTFASCFGFLAVLVSSATGSRFDTFCSRLP